MGAPEVLQHLQAAGLHLALSEGKIIVTPRAKLTDELRTSIKDNRETLIQALAPTRRSGNPLMTAEQTEACHVGAWDDAEIETFTARVLMFMRRGSKPSAADELAERLTLRDREQDDRRLCLECSNLSDTGRCIAAASGRLPGADKRTEPIQTTLQRCPAFGLRKGLH